MRGVARTETLPPFNNGCALEVVVLDDGERLGVVSRDAGLGVPEAANGLVWDGFAMVATLVHDPQRMRRVALPQLPAHYGRWVHTSIGGISATVRRVDVLRSHASARPVALFALGARDATTIRLAFGERDASAARFTVGDSEFHEEHGHVTEVVVHASDDVAEAAAVIARAGATPMLEDGALDTRRSIGIERLDRIGARVSSEPGVVTESDSVYGLRRGTDNWKFSWLPSEWQEVPITWDHMVSNVLHHPLATLPRPLRQYVARRRLEDGLHDPVGARWRPCGPNDVPSEAVLAWNAALPAEAPLEHVLKRVVALSPEDAARVRAGSGGVTVRVPLNCVTLVDGVWYRPEDPWRAIEQHLPKRRLVTPHLTSVQSRQLIEAFYLLTVERVEDATQRQALRLILFHYMKERGYTARWIGKYEQDGVHIGNGDSFRMFRRLDQYAPGRLPVDVLNRLLGADGRLVNRGSKGTRSKYEQPGRKRYVPRRRLQRTRADEEAMR